MYKNNFQSWAIFQRGPFSVNRVSCVEFVVVGSAFLFPKLVEFYSIRDRLVKREDMIDKIVSEKGWCRGCRKYIICGGDTS